MKCMCGKSEIILADDKKYICQGCGLVIRKNIRGKEITLDIAEMLFSQGRTQVMHGFARKGKKYSAILEVSDTKKVILKTEAQK